MRVLLPKDRRQQGGEGASPERRYLSDKRAGHRGINSFGSFPFSVLLPEHWQSPQEPTSTNQSARGGHMFVENFAVPVDKAQQHDF